MCVEEGRSSDSNALYLGHLRRPGEDSSYVSLEHKVWAGGNLPRVIAMGAEFKIPGRNVEKDCRENTGQRKSWVTLHNLSVPHFTPL